MQFNSVHIFFSIVILAGCGTRIWMWLPSTNGTGWARIPTGEIWRGWVNKILDRFPNCPRTEFAREREE